MNLLFTQLLSIARWFETDIPCFLFLGEYDFPEE